MKDKTKKQKRLPAGPHYRVITHGGVPLYGESLYEAQRVLVCCRATEQMATSLQRTMNYGRTWEDVTDEGEPLPPKPVDEDCDWLAHRARPRKTE